MKEFTSQTGGRYTYIDDIMNLQNLALAFTSIFDECDNFIISGCQVSGTSISAGYVYINGKIRYCAGTSGVSKWPMYLYENNSVELRYRNSTENDFVKLLYNYDSIIEDETDTVILVEGVFDVIALTRKLNLYNNPSVAVVATFGKKISDTQIYKLQAKGVHTIVIGYDGDATEAIKKTGDQLNEYFDCYVADIEDSSQDFDSMDFWEIYDTFAFRLKTLTEYKLNKI